MTSLNLMCAHGNLNRWLWNPHAAVHGSQGACILAERVCLVNETREAIALV